MAKKNRSIKKIEKEIDRLFEKKREKNRSIQKEINRLYDEWSAIWDEKWDLFKYEMGDIRITKAVSLLSNSEIKKVAEHISEHIDDLVENALGR